MPDDCQHEGILATLEDSGGRVYASAYSFYYDNAGRYHQQSNDQELKTEEKFLQKMCTEFVKPPIGPEWTQPQGNEFILP